MIDPHESPTTDDPHGRSRRPSTKGAPALGRGGGPPAALGRFAIEGEIGHGGMGAVFKGRDPDLGRGLAIKILHPRHAGNGRLERRFLEEARIAGGLEHQGVPAASPCSGWGGTPRRLPT